MDVLPTNHNTSESTVHKADSSDSHQQPIHKELDAEYYADALPPVLEQRASDGQ
jgi:hypothetical protein